MRISRPSGKIIICGLCLLGPIYAFSQTTPAPKPTGEVRRYLKEASVPAYKSLSDTIAPTLYLSKTEKLVQVDGSSPRWVKVRRGTTDLFVSERFIEPLAAAGATNLSGKRVRTIGPATYAVAKTNSSLIGRGRFLMLDEGVIHRLKDAYYQDEQGLAMEFETEAAVLNFLDSLGWIITSSRQELFPQAGMDLNTGPSRKYAFDNVYILKRKSTETK
ncbi:hypothetical protein GCM10022406_39270 [Hymenobacter algoricola]|uniref:Uncharacterized protein n=2 Tax=Hymenobacter algoricola TaxID=486267 RepID=A0ABP7NTJ1_9BACT